MSAERADNYKVLQDIKKRNPKSAVLIQEMINQILNFARQDGQPIKSAIVIVDESMIEEEKEMALFEGFLREGCSPEEADRKIREWIEMEEKIDEEFNKRENMKLDGFLTQLSKKSPTYRSGG